MDGKFNLIRKNYFLDFSKMEMKETWGFVRERLARLKRDSFFFYSSYTLAENRLIAVHELSSIQSWNSWPACIKSLWSGIRRSWTSRSLVLSFQSVAPLLLLSLQSLSVSPKFRIIPWISGLFEYRPSVRNIFNCNFIQSTGNWLHKSMWIFNLLRYRNILSLIF